jgi:hypothetical protein
MTFTLKKFNSVAVGTFNMYIIQPHWMTRKGFLPEGLEVRVQVNMSEPGLKFGSTELGMVWEVSPTRLVVQSELPTVNSGERLREIVHALPDTPLTAVGHNFSFIGDVSDLGTIGERLREMAPALPNPQDVLVNQTFGLVVARGERTFTVAMTMLPDSAEISVNVNAVVRDREPAEAWAALQRFQEDRNESVGILRTLVGNRIAYDN